MIWFTLPFLFIPQVYHFEFEHSRAARDLAKKYERAVLLAQVQMTEQISRYNRTLAKELQRVLREETMAGKLDAAIEVRDAIAALEEGKRNLRRSDRDGYEHFIGTWHIQYQNGNTHTFEISRGKGRRFAYREFARVINGTASGPVDIRHTLIAEGGFLWLNGRAACTRFHVSNGFLYVEYWNNSPVPRGVSPGFAVGRKVAGKKNP